MNAPAPRAQFAPNPFRRHLLAKVHLAKKELRLTDDDYRQILMDVAGKASAADLSGPELGKVVAHFEARGFKGSLRANPNRIAAADNPVARKARALWISLYQLGAVQNRDDRALEAFAARQCGVERMQWMNQALGYKLIEALKAMGERHGWDQSVEGLANVSADGRVRLLRTRLCEAILAKLKTAGIAAAEWSLADAAWSLLGEEGPASIWWPVEQLERLAAGLGAKLRDAGAVA